MNPAENNSQSTYSLGNASSSLISIESKPRHLRFTHFSLFVICFILLNLAFQPDRLELTNAIKEIDEIETLVSELKMNFIESEVVAVLKSIKPVNVLENDSEYCNRSKNCFSGLIPTLVREESEASRKYVDVVSPYFGSKEEYQVEENRVSELSTSYGLKDVRDSRGDFRPPSIADIVNVYANGKLPDEVLPLINGILWDADVWTTDELPHRFTIRQFELLPGLDYQGQLSLSKKPETLLEFKMLWDSWEKAIIVNRLENLLNNYIKISSSNPDYLDYIKSGGRFMSDEIDDMFRFDGMEIEVGGGIRPLEFESVPQSDPFGRPSAYRVNFRLVPISNAARTSLNFPSEVRFVLVDWTNFDSFIRKLSITSGKPISHTIIPVVTDEVSKIYAQDLILRDYSVAENWGKGNFSSTFSTLDSLTDGFQQFTFLEINSILRSWESRVQSQISFFGITASAISIALFGSILVLVVQFYFAMHMAAVSLIDMENWRGYPWIAIYKSLLPRVGFVLSAIVLPATTVLILALSDILKISQLSPFVWVLLATLSISLSIYSWVAYRSWFVVERSPEIKITNNADC